MPATSMPAARGAGWVAGADWPPAVRVRAPTQAQDNRTRVATERVRFMSSPLGIVVAAAAPFFHPETQREHGKHLDERHEPVHSEPCEGARLGPAYAAGVEARLGD